MPDHQRSAAFFLLEGVCPLGIRERFDYDRKNGPLSHPDLNAFGKEERLDLRLREGVADSRTAQIDFVAGSRKQVEGASAAAIAAGATDNGAPGFRLYYDPRYDAANAFDPDGYRLEFVYKSWQH